MANLTKGYGSISPELMTIERSDNEILYASINLNIECINGKYEWDEIVLPEYALNEIHKADKDIKYSVLIAHIIKAYYNDHQMSAIVNNYIMDTDDEEHKNEFLEMQRIRKLAKDTAKQIIRYNIF
jgi:hypothetical protein